MKRQFEYSQEENFWPTFTDVMMAFILVLIFFLLGMIVMNLDTIIYKQIQSKQARMEQILKDAFSQEFEKKEISIVADGDKQIISFSDRILFDSGSDILKPQGKNVISKLAKILKTNQKEYFTEISVEGNTDTDVAGGVLRSNWHLSCARAVSVVQTLQNYKIDPRILSATGFGEYKPKILGSSGESKRINRRIDVRLDYSANKIRKILKESNQKANN